ncbi:hypothetical protein C4D60_Mb03t21280 [Musa balbisiana]|uniref:Uncharacterized protein n=1 Tax=Musa balbisiana TaxID=52838 RepID=A0A4S8JBG5_MUSBA|nr:hypothetical protein C4D60_Mb03t21280 [Musa balbisiana]
MATAATGGRLGEMRSFSKSLDAAVLLVAKRATIVAVCSKRNQEKEKASYNEEERWGSAGEHSNRDAAVEGNRRWRRVAVEKTVVVRRGGKICHTDDLTTKKH